MKYRVLIVDDDLLFRKCLVALIALNPRFEVAGELDASDDWPAAPKSTQADLVLLDLGLTGDTGLERVARLKLEQPRLRLLVISQTRAVAQARACLRAGADGYQLKDVRVEEFMASLEAVACGRVYLNPGVAGDVVECFLHPENARKERPLKGILTSRERGVFQLIAEGRTNRSAAELLHVSTKTVAKHRYNLMHKLGFRNCAELTAAAVALGLVDCPKSVNVLKFGPDVGLLPR